MNAGDANGANDVATKEVVAICVVLFPTAGVGACGVPVNVGLATGANDPIEFCTKAVVAICDELVPFAAVGATGTPVKTGLARGANDVATKEVVASCVELVPTEAVGPAGTPVNVGDARGAYVERVVALAGVKPSALVTSEDCRVIAPVRELNDSTLLACAGISCHAVPAKMMMSPTFQFALPLMLVVPATLTL